VDTLPFREVIVELVISIAELISRANTGWSLAISMLEKVTLFTNKFAETATSRGAENC